MERTIYLRTIRLSSVKNALSPSRLKTKLPLLQCSRPHFLQAKVSSEQKQPTLMVNDAFSATLPLQPTSLHSAMMPSFYYFRVQPIPYPRKTNLYYFIKTISCLASFKKTSHFIRKFFILNLSHLKFIWNLKLEIGNLQIIHLNSLQSLHEFG